MFSSTFCYQSPSFEHFLDAIRIRQSKKRWRRLGLLRREDVKTKLSRKKKLAPALLGWLGSDTAEGFFYFRLCHFLKKHIFPPANEPREDKCENVTFGNASDLFKRFGRGLYLPRAVGTRYPQFHPSIHPYTQTNIGFGGMSRIFVNEDFCSKKVLLCIHSDFDSPSRMLSSEGISMLSSSNDTWVNSCQCESSILDSNTQCRGRWKHLIPS